MPACMGAESSRIRGSWKNLMRWSRILSRSNGNGICALDATDKVVVFGGGSFGTAMAVSLARQKRDLNVMMLIRDPYVCRDINKAHVNSRYLQVRALRVAGSLRSLRHAYVLPISVA